MKNTKLFTTLMIVTLILLAWLKFSGNNAENNSNNVSTDMQSSEYAGDETQILLYFLDSDGVKLAQEYRYVSMKDIQEDMPKTIVEELLKGPTTSEFASAIPTGTKLNSVMQEGGKAIVDFSSEFTSELIDESVKFQRIYSVVNTLTEIKEINEVEIRVNGETIATEKRI